MWRGHRDTLEQDLHSHYGIDVDLSEPLTCKVLRAHSWRWFLVRVYGLLNDPDTRLFTALSPKQPRGDTREPEHR